MGTQDQLRALTEGAYWAEWVEISRNSALGAIRDLFCSEERFLRHSGSRNRTGQQGNGPPNPAGSAARSVWVLGCDQPCAAGTVILSMSGAAADAFVIEMVFVPAASASGTV